ncbi:MAG: acid shock protein [Streptomycetaceae bacterium]|nr:acid shock protein [Streptomycetaceae bacterium]
MLALVCAATLSLSPAAFASDAAPQPHTADSGDRAAGPGAPTGSGNSAGTQNITGGSDTKAAAEPEQCVGSTADQTYAVGDGGTSHAAGPGAGDVAPDQLTTARNADGRVEVYALAQSDHTLWKRFETAPGGTWSGWVQAGPAMACRIAVGTNADGRIELFGIVADSREIWHSWQTAVNGGFSGWSKFSGPAADVTVGANADGRMEVFARNPQTLEVYNSFQLRPSGGWAGWTRFAGPAASVAIGVNDDLRMEVFAQNPTTLEVYNTYQVAPNAGWAGWRRFAGPALDLKVGTDLEGRQHLFARSPGTTNLYHVQQTGPNRPWGAWGQLGGPSAGVSVGLTGFGLSVFAVDPSTRLVWESFQTDTGFDAWHQVSDQPLATPPTPGTSFDDAHGSYWSHLFGVTTGGQVVRSYLDEFEADMWDWHQPWVSFTS